MVAARAGGEGERDVRRARAPFAEQGGLLAAKIGFEQGKLDDARASLAWVADNADQPEYRSIARLRLAALLLEQKQYDAALAQLDAANAKTFEPLVADRRGDVLLAQGKKDEARAAYERAYAAMDATVDYRRLVEAKLTALGAAPVSAAASAASGAAK
jgi:predicted negative regulator of RcsB-dependent stress response